MKKQTSKKVKGWVILSEDKKDVASVMIGSEKPRVFYIGSWSFSSDNEDLIPCTITYTLPSPKKR